MQPFRFNVLVDDARALKDAGWSQELADGDDRYIVLGRSHAKLFSSFPVDEAFELVAAAPSFHDLLGWLWQEGYFVTLLTGPESYNCVTIQKQDDAFNMTAKDMNPVDLLANAVLHALRGKQREAAQPNTLL